MEYTEIPIHIVSGNEDCISFFVNQTWKEDDYINYIATQYDDCNTTETICEPRGQFYPFSRKCGPYNAQCQNGTAIIDVFIADRNMTLVDNATIPEICWPPFTLGKKCSWKFKVTCGCP